jgi:hypothetical protein
MKALGAGGSEVVAFNVRSNASPTLSMANTPD